MIQNVKKNTSSSIGFVLVFVRFTMFLDLLYLFKEKCVHRRLLKFTTSLYYFSHGPDEIPGHGDVVLSPTTIPNCIFVHIAR